MAARTYRDETPATNNSSEQLTTTDVDVPRAEGHKIIGCADGVGRDVDAERDNDQADGCKGGGRATSVRSGFHPLVDYHDRVPDDLAVGRLSGGCGEDAEEADDCCGRARMIS